MKVILTIGNPHSGYEAVEHILNQAGISSAQASNKASMSPQALQAQLLRSHEIDLIGNAPLGQVQPGKLWNELATDLFLANLQHPTWGWADPQSAVLMDFWHDFDAQVRLLLVYNSPANYLEQVLSQHAQPTPENIAMALDEWAHWNTNLLRYLHRHPDYCVLVNSQQAAAEPQTLVDTLASHWQISGLNSTATSAAGTHAYQRLQAHFINQLIDPQHPALALLQELDGAALWSATPSTTPAADAEPTASADWADWADWAKLRANLAHLESESAAKSDALAQLSQQLEQCQAQLAQASAQASQASLEGTELKQENDLLLLQLHQVQEELEHYFLRHQELEKSQNSKAVSFVTDFWRMHQPQELVISMQQNIAGSNWYPAESDGRWAGPATLSTLQMPPVQPGNYTLDLDIVDAMNLDIVNSLVVEALGQTMPVEVFYPLYKGEYPLICKVQLRVSDSATQQAWLLNLRFTQAVCPADNGSDDMRNLSIRLRTLKLVKQA
jgi:hypothetical protein